jgi:hypothetical protein
MNEGKSPVVSKLRLGLGFFLVLLPSLFVGYILGKPLFMVNCSEGPVVSQFPNIEEEQGAFVNHDHTGALKLLYMPIRLQPRTNCVVSFKARNTDPKEPVKLNIDLFGDGYQFDEQKRQVPLLPGNKEIRVAETIYSGAAVPEHASLRIHFSEPASVIIREITIVREYKYLRRALWWSVLGCLLMIGGLSWFVARTDDHAFLGLRRLTREQKLQLGFVAAFGLLLVAPAMQNEFKFIQYQPLDENRRKLEKPEGNLLVRLFQDGPDYSKAYEKYFNDHYGFRDVLIELKNQIDYSVFHRSDEVLIGKEGWMEYRNVLAGQMLFAERYTAEDWQRIYDRLEQLRSYLAGRGITLILMPIQNKFSLYPEYAPDQLVRRPARTAFDRFCEGIAARPAFVSIDIRSALLREKPKQPVFYKTDFHWNSIGAFYGAAETVNTLGKLSGRPVRWEHPLEFTYRQGFIGGLNRSLAALYPPREDEIVIKPTWKTRGTYLDPQPPFEVHFRAEAANAPRLLPPTLLLGNSFSYNFIQTGFYEYFSEIYLLHSKRLNELPQNIPPGIRYVILQFIEADIGVYFWNHQHWPNYPTTGPERRGP